MSKCRNNCMNCSNLFYEESFKGRVMLKCLKGYQINISRVPEEKETASLVVYKNSDLLGISVYDLINNYSLLCNYSEIIGFVDNDDVERFKKEKKNFAINYGMFFVNLKDWPVTFKALTYEFMEEYYDSRND